MRRLKTIVVGVGHLGRVHARILSKLPGVRLIGVVDPDSAAREAAATECRTNAYASLDALEGKFEAAVVAAPTHLHRDVGLALLNRGIHCLIEKPLCDTAAAAEDLIVAAKRNGVVLQVGHVERFNPALEPAAAYVRDPKFIEATRAGAFSGRSTDIGVVFDLMIHDIDLVLSMVNSPLRDLEAFGLSVLGPHEDIAHARLRFAGGCVAVLNASRVSPQAERSMRIWSQEGLARIDFAHRTSSVLAPSDAIRERRLDVSTMSAESSRQVREDLFTRYLQTEEFTVEPRDALTAELEDFVEAIRTGRPPRVTGEHARGAISIAEGVLAAISGHAWDGHRDGRVGPLANPEPDVIPSPHWRQPRVIPLDLKEAG